MPHVSLRLQTIRCVSTLSKILPLDFKASASTTWHKKARIQGFLRLEQKHLKIPSSTRPNGDDCMRRIADVILQAKLPIIGGLYLMTCTTTVANIVPHHVRMTTMKPKLLVRTNLTCLSLIGHCWGRNSMILCSPDAPGTISSSPRTGTQDLVRRS